MLQFRFQLCGCGVHFPQQVGAFRRFLAAAQQHNENELSEYGAMLSGVLHLSPEDRRILMEQVGQFLRSHDTAKAENLEHWEYVILAYRA